MGETPQTGAITAERNQSPASSTPKKGDVSALLALLAAMIVWSATFPVMKVALASLHPVFMMAARMALAFCMLLPFLPRLRTETNFRKKDTLLPLTVLLVCDPCLYFLFESYALRYTSSSQAGMVVALLPLMVGAGAFFLLKEKQSVTAWIGITLALGGVIWLSLAGRPEPAAPNPVLGNLLEFAAMSAACAYTLCVRKLGGFPPFLITFLQSAAGAGFFGLLLFATDAPLPENISFNEAACLAFLGIAGILGYGLYNIGIARFSAGQAAAACNLLPVFTLGMGLFFLEETLTAGQTFALIPVFLGVFLSQLPKRASKQL